MKVRWGEGKASLSERVCGERERERERESPGKLSIINTNYLTITACTG